VSLQAAYVENHWFKASRDKLSEILSKNRLCRGKVKGTSRHLSHPKHLPARRHQEECEREKLTNNREVKLYFDKKADFSNHWLLSSEASLI